jgi:uncharacterized UPF0160 family protein
VVVVRTRRPDWVAAGQADPTVFVIDVGAQHDYARRNLDHHHKGFTETWPNGCPLSSTGLVWRWLGQNGHLDVLSAPERAELEERLIQPLDAHDNGVASSPIAAGLAPHNRTGTDESQDVQFRVALDMMRGVLTNTLHGARARLEAERVLTDAWRLAARRGVPYVVLNRPVSYTDCATLLRRLSGGQAHLLALPGRGQRWSIISLPGDDGHFSVKCPCPQEWRGRFDLNTTVDGRPLRVVFGHKTGFMSTVLGSRIDVQAACRHIIRTAGLPMTTVPPPHSSHGASSSAPIMSIQTPEAPPRISAFPPGRPMPSAVPSGASAPQSVSSRPSSSARKPQRPSDRVVSAGRPAAAHPYPTKSPATPPAAPSAPSADADAASAKSVHPSTVSPPIAVVPSKGAQGDRPGSKIRAPQFRRQKPSR